MGILGDATVVSAQTGRKLNNALTLTFKTSPDETLATAVQAKSLGVLFGFRNGGKGRYDLSGNGSGNGDELTVECDSPQTRLTGAGGASIGSIEKGDNGEGIIRAADGTVVGRLAVQPKDKRSDPAWEHLVTDANGEVLGLLTWLRTTGKFDLVGELTDMYIWWDHAGQSLKVPSLGAHVALAKPVPQPLGDLLLAACVDITVGTHSFIQT